MNQKTHKYTSCKLGERKPQKIGDSNNNNRVGTRKCSIKKMFEENFAKITVKYLCRVLFLYKVLGLLRRRYFPVNIAKLLRATFSERPRWLLLLDVAKLKKKKNRIHTI